MLKERVATVIEVIRPAIQADQGDIFLRDVDEESGVVSVELVGACVSCPASTQTLKAGIERILKDRVEGVTSVEHVGARLAGADGGAAARLAGADGGAAARLGGADEGTPVSL